MTQPDTKSLLRRTAVAIAAAAVSLFTLPASALTMSLPGGGTCTTPTIQTDPSGNLTLTCGSSGAPAPAGPPTVYITNTYSQLPLSASTTGTSGDPPAAGATVSNVVMARSNSSTGDITVNYNISGSGCYVNGFPPPATGAVTLTGTALQSQPIGLVATAGGSICSIGIISISPAASGTVPVLSVTGATGTQQPNHVDIPVSLTLGGGTQPGTGTGTGSNPPPTGANGVPIVAGCPTPTSATMFTMPATPGAHPGNQGTQNGSLVFPSGVVGAAPLPATLLVSGVQHASAQLELTYSAFTPTNVINIEMAISKCPGIIDVVADGQSLNSYQPVGCYYHSSNPADLTLAWFGKLSDGVTAAYAAASGRCTALEVDPTTGQPVTWYANIRYTYSGNCYNGDCGEQFQWNDYTP